MSTPAPKHCCCNTERHDPDCHIDHTLSILEASLSFPQRRQVSTPDNPMHSRCGLEDCDCEYTIEKLRAMVGRLAILAEAMEGGATASLFDWLKIRDEARIALDKEREGRR